MKRIFFITLMIGALILAPAAANSSLDQDVTVKVGLLTPQTGSLSPYSGGFERAAALAVSDLNADAEFDGYTFELSVYDTATDPAQAEAAMTIAVEAGVHYVAGAAASSMTMAAAEVAVEAGVPMISYASTSPFITSFDDHKVAGDEGYLWRIPPSDTLQGKVLADLAAAAGVTKMVVVAVDSSYGIFTANSTKDNFEATSGNTATIVTYAETQSDFETTVQTILAEEPGVIVAISYATDGSLLFLELDAQGYTGKVIGAEYIGDEGIFSDDPGTADAMEGFAVVNLSAVVTDSVIAFEEAYAAAYPDASGDIYIGETYDAVKAGALAVKAGASTAGSDIIANLGAVSFDGATGPLAFDENGDSTAGFYRISTVVSASFKEVATWDSNGLNWLDSAFEASWKTVEQTSSSVTNSAETSQEVPQSGGVTIALPMSFLWIVIPLFAIPILRRK
jgi:branched-chain amino acid transport system substrate-binding protein